uniref:Uncharacterized protein n=1 Tax=Arundo donax TaxID=35708 RepID=A0A0A8XTR1_ARUDO
MLCLHISFEELLCSVLFELGSCLSYK